MATYMVVLSTDDSAGTHLEAPRFCQADNENAARAEVMRALIARYANRQINYCALIVRVEGAIVINGGLLETMAADEIQQLVEDEIQQLVESAKHAVT